MNVAKIFKNTYFEERLETATSASYLSNVAGSFFKRGLQLSCFHGQFKEFFKMIILMHTSE